MIYTVGYQNITIEQLEKIMNEKNIGLLIDVRSIPYSRNPQKYEFNKNRLQNLLGTRYIWMGDVCGGKHGHVSLNCIETLQLHNIPGAQNILLLCLENDPCDCHRYCDIGKRLFENGIDIVHLFDGNEVKTSELIKGGSHEIFNRDRSKKTL